MTAQGRASRSGARTFVLRSLLAVVGLGIVAYLVRGVGTDRVLEVLREAGPWLPVVIALELAQLGCDWMAIRTIVGDLWQTVPLSTLVRSAGIAYAMMVLLPAGRAAGEVTRATILSRYLGVPRAAAASTQLQAAYLAANGLMSAAAYGVVAARLGVGSSLALMLLANVLFQAVISIGLIAMVQNARLGQWLDGVRRRVLGRHDESPSLDPSIRRRIPWRSAGICSLARLAQVTQYGVVLHAVGGVFSVRGAFVAHGIHLVGATLGDFLPNQLGVVDGAYRAFAADVGFADAPARALSIALVARAAQLLTAGGCVVAAALTRPAAAHPPDEGAREPAGANPGS